MASCHLYPHNKFRLPIDKLISFVYSSFGGKEFDSPAYLLQLLIFPLGSPKFLCPNSSRYFSDQFSTRRIISSSR
ncbi:hypothetical protein Csa_014734, partial [Cucumis sativus]